MCEVFSVVGVFEPDAHTLRLVSLCSRHALFSNLRYDFKAFLLSCLVSPFSTFK